MRLAIVACLVLAGCAAEIAETPEERVRRWDREAQEQIARDAHSMSPQGRAEANCRTRVQFAMAGFRDRSILGLEAMARGNQLHAECMDYWRRTGQMP